MSSSPSLRSITLTILPFFLTFSLIGYLGRRLIPALSQVQPVDSWEGADRALAFVMTPIWMSTPLEAALVVVGLTLLLGQRITRQWVRAECAGDRLELIRTAAFAGWVFFALAAIFVTAFARHAVEQKAVIFAAL
ncbi:MAG TPA: hypothetical protein VMU42_19515 [Candidatus Sulfotelmatobacter sp.]|nr:hypothetical protein [Candidatus Sulfotelmatobacter sp.]